MNPILVTGIDNLVATPGVKDPAFPRAHMDGLIATVEHYLWIGDYGDMDSYSAIPVVIKIYMFANLCPGIQAHQP